MSKWWMNPRSLLAARVRSFRKRLRASYRASVAKARAEEVRRANDAIREAQRDLQRQRDAITNEIVAMGFLRTTVMPREHQLDREVVCAVRISDKIFYQCDPRGLRMTLADMIGRAVQQAIEDRGLEPIAGKSLR